MAKGEDSMSKTWSDGSFDVKFKTERAYERFGVEFAKCYANLQVAGEMHRPIPAGGSTYRVKFHLGCGCDTVLGEFKSAYDKTFEAKPAVTAGLVDGVIEDREFTAWMQVCGRDYVLVDPHADVERATRHFAGGPPAPAEDPPYVDKDGLIQFIVASQLVGDGNVMAKVTDLANTLVACSSIVTSYVNRASVKDPAKRFDSKFWYDTVSHLPLFGPSKLETKTYDNEVVGIEIASAFINFIMDAIASGDALGSFKKFLTDEGKNIHLGISNNKGQYSTITNGVVSEVLEVGKEIVYLPKLKLYYILFNRESQKVTTSCGSYEKVKIHLEYTEATGLFDYMALNDPEVKKKFDKFIQDSRKAQIQDAETFFQDDFDVEMPGVLALSRR
jgi:Virulence factor Evf